VFVIKVQIPRPVWIPRAILILRPQSITVTYNLGIKNTENPVSQLGRGLWVKFGNITISWETRKGWSWVCYRLFRACILTVKSYFCNQYMMISKLAAGVPTLNV
jgi:hypothetical protein